MAHLHPHFVWQGEEGRYLWRDVDITCDIPIIRETLRNALTADVEDGPSYTHVRFHLDLPMDIEKRLRNTFNVEDLSLDEGHILVADDGIDIYSQTPRGLFYGCQTLIHSMRGQFLGNCLIYDFPVCVVRGVKLMLPPPDKLDDFKEFIDFLCVYKYNTVMLEVGGAMEYKRHPEINDGWVAYCAEMNEYPGKTRKIQGQYDWEKNSIHSENGGGRFLSQDAVKDLAAYCRERMLEVIPEVPSLSHSDYLLTRHPELNERTEDPYPDTYCPSNPDSYKLLFDVFDEVIEVFQPATINIGHDEYYTIGLCERCRGKKAEDLYAGDIRRIYDHLAAKGVRTMLWAEKFLDSHWSDGVPIGGAEKPKTPATYRAINMVPQDLRILHWYWGINRTYELEYLKRGMEMTYGNFTGLGFPAWRERVARDGVQGAIISNWGATDGQTLQRNAILFNVVYSAYLFWNGAFDDSRTDEVRDLTFRELYRYRGEAARRNAAPNARFLTFVHTTDTRIEHEGFVDGNYIDNEQFALGEYVIEYEDGSEHAVPIIWGLNISSQDVNWDLKEFDRADCSTPDSALIEASYTARPQRMDGRTWYETEVEDRFPQKRITGVRVRKRLNAPGNVYLRSFGVSAAS